MNPTISLSAVFMDVIFIGIFSSFVLERVNKVQQINVSKIDVIKYTKPSVHSQLLLKSTNHSVRKIGANEVATNDNLANLLSILSFTS